MFRLFKLFSKSNFEKSKWKDCFSLFFIMILKIIRLNEKDFFNDLKILNLKIEEIDEMKRDNNFLFLLDKKKLFRFRNEKSQKIAK